MSVPEPPVGRHGLSRVTMFVVSLLLLCASLVLFWYAWADFILLLRLARILLAVGMFLYGLTLLWDAANRVGANAEEFTAWMVLNAAAALFLLLAVSFWVKQRTFQHDLERSVMQRLDAQLDAFRQHNPP